MKKDNYPECLLNSVLSRIEEKESRIEEYKAKIQQETDELNILLMAKKGFESN